MDKLSRQRVSVLAVAAVVALVILGCGSSDSTSTGTPASLTKNQFVERSDKICERRLEEKDAAVKAALKKLSSSEIANPSAQGLEELGESIIPPMQKLVAELREMPAPVKDEIAVDGFISKLEAGLKKAEADPGGLAQNDPFEEAAKAARAYGLKGCNL